MFTRFRPSHIRRQRIGAWGAFALSAWLVVGAATVSPAQAAASIDTVTTASVYGSLRTNGAGLYDQQANTTFVAFSGTNHDIYVRAFAHAPGTWSTPVEVATLNLTDDNAYHDYPVLTQLSDGRLAVFRAQHNRAAYMYTAPSPRSISGTWAASRISTDKNTYLEPVVIGNSVYVFYSQSTDLSYPYRTYRVITSRDSGRTWGSPQTVIDSGRAADRYAEVYAFGVTRRDSRIFVTWSLHGGPLGHNRAGKDIYVAYLETGDNTMRSVGGTDFGATITGNEMGGARAVATNPADLPSGKTLPEENPVAVQLANGTVVLGYGIHTRNSARIVLARYAGGSWASSTIDSGTSLFKDIVASGDSVEIVYATADNRRLVSKRWNPASGGLATRFDVGIPYQGGADTVFYANFVENRASISVIASTINYVDRRTNDIGRWPVFAVRN